MKPIRTLPKKNCSNLHLLNLPCLQLTLGRTLFHLKRVEVFELLPHGTLGLIVLLSVILSIRESTFSFNELNLSRRIDSKISSILFKSLGYKLSITKLLLKLLSSLPGISLLHCSSDCFHILNPTQYLTRLILSMAFDNRFRFEYEPKLMVLLSYAVF